MPVRKIPRSYRNVTGRVTHQHQSWAFEGPLERDYYTLLTEDPNVKSVHPQCVQVKFVNYKGKTVVCYPDVLIHYAFGRRPLLADVKTREEIKRDWKELKPRFKAARAFATQQGWKYKIKTEKEIRTQYLESVKFFRGYRNIPVDEVCCQRIIRAVRGESGWTAHMLMNRMGQVLKMHPGEVLTLIWHLVATGRLQTDWNQPVLGTSAIWVESAA